MIDTKTTVFATDEEILGIFNLSDEQMRLLDWLGECQAFDGHFWYETFSTVEDM